MNRLTRFLIGPQVRGEWVELGDAWREVTARHTLDPVATRILGELTAAALLLAATIKHRGSLTAQITGGEGAISLAVVECHADGRYRSTIKYSERVPRPADQADPMAWLNPVGKARFVITLDPRDGEQSTYQGVVPLEGGSIAEALEQYMLRSEQLPTRLWLAANERQTVGLLLQRLPEGGSADMVQADADTWPRVQQLADTLQPAEMLTSDADTMIRRLFWQEAVSSTESRPLHFACSCSRERVARMLQSLGADEVQDILDEQGAIIVHCDYCNQRHDFDAVDSLALFSTGLAPGSETPQ